MGFRLSKITTRTGDAGETGLGNGTRVGKDHQRIAVLGDVDELNSSIGLLACEDLPAELVSALQRIQNDLFDLGGELSVPGQSLLRDAQVVQLEAWVKELNAQLPPLQEFILPGGCRAAAQAHVARTICRRTERAVVSLNRREALGLLPQIYLNRLSDLLFILARTANRHAGVKEPMWQRRT
jgi:cob(I)alamin adenosyltransferase